MNICALKHTFDMGGYAHITIQHHGVINLLPSSCQNSVGLVIFALDANERIGGIVVLVL